MEESGGILDRDILKSLLFKHRYSLIQEFYRVFGDGATWKLLDIFAGTRIKVPSAREIRIVKRDVFIYRSMLKVKGDLVVGQKCKDDLAKKFSLTSARVAQIYIEVKEICES